MDLNLTGVIAANVSLMQPQHADYSDLINAVIPAFFGILGVAVGAYAQFKSVTSRQIHDDQKEKEKREYKEENDRIEKRKKIYRQFLLTALKIISLKDILKKDAKSITEFDILNTYADLLFSYADIRLFGDSDIAAESVKFNMEVIKYLQNISKKSNEDVFNESLELGKKWDDLADKMSKDVKLSSGRELNEIKEQLKI